MAFAIKKKAQTDLIYILLLIVIAIFITPVISMVFSETNDVVQNITDVPAEGKALVSELSTGFSSDADFVIICIIFGLYIGGIVLASYLNIDPIFIVIGLLLMVLLMWVGAQVADSFYDITTDGSEYAGEVSSNFPMSQFYMNYFLEINIGFIVVMLIVLYYKHKEGYYG